MPQVKAVRSGRATHRRRSGPPPAPTADAPRSSETDIPWYQRTLTPALLSGALVWASLPPLGWWPLAWIAPVGWILLIRRVQLVGRRPYAALWVAGFLFWMAELHWLRLPHPATSIGWVAISVYLACYLPVFVGLSRVAVHQLRVPVILAAPVLWTGLELVRGHLLTGFTMASLGHSQYPWLAVIQVADLAGAYGVGFVVMFVAACLGRMPACNTRRFVAWPLVPLVLMLLAVLGYGHMRLADAPTAADGPRIALIQGSIDTTLKADESKRSEVFRHYFTLSQQALEQDADVDLIVWPETMFRDPLITFTDDVHPPEGAEWRVDDLQYVAQRNREMISDTAIALDTELLLGVDVLNYGPGVVESYNAAIHVNRAGEIVGRYDKMHPVMFGEYIPLGRIWPWLYHLTPLSTGLIPGERPEVFEVGGTRLAVNICYEDLVPHLIAGQVRSLRREGREPDVLVNLTNDGWFWGSSELDLHLIGGLFRAVECRKPLLIAANTGLSAWIDGDGRILAQGPRRDTAVLLTQVGRDHRRSPYVRYGDLPAGLCLLACLIVAGVGTWGWMQRWRRRSKALPDKQ